MLGAYVLQQRELKRYLIERKSVLKWQQTLTILDTQSDGIVAVQTSKRDEASGDKELPIVFSNKKLQSLFNFDLFGGKRGT